MSRWTSLLLVAAASGIAGAETREVGNLILDGVPEVPRRIADRNNQYLECARRHCSQDWDPDGRGLLILDRFGDTAQMHHVAGPLARDCEQLTFLPEPVPSRGVRAKTRRPRLRSTAATRAATSSISTTGTSARPGAHTLVTDGKSRNEGSLPSNGGTRFAFASTLRNGKDFDLYVLDSLDGRTRTACANVPARGA